MSIHAESASSTLLSGGGRMRKSAGGPKLSVASEMSSVGISIELATGSTEGVALKQTRLVKCPYSMIFVL